MKNVMVCRFCLATDNTFISINNKITAKNVVTVFGYSATEDDGLPQYLCAFCCYLVAKFASFRRRCDMAQTVFENAALEGRKVTTTYIESLDRNSIGVCLPLEKAATKSINIQYMQTTIDVKEELDEIFDKTSDINILDIDVKEIFINGDNEDHLTASTHSTIKENTKELVNMVIKHKKRNIGIAKIDNDKDTGVNIDLKEELIVSNVSSAISAKEKKKRNESIDAVKRNKNRRIAKNKKGIRIMCIENYDLNSPVPSTLSNFKEQSVTKESIDVSKKNKKRIDNVAKNKNKKGVCIKFKEDYVVISILSKAEQLKELQRRSNSDSYINSQFKCKKCYKGFNANKAFNNHMVKHDVSSGEYMCEICEIRCLTSKKLRSHVLKVHERKFACKQCNHVSVNTSEARMHHKEHNNFLYNCKYCDTTYRKKSSYLGHVRLKHPSDDVCDICGASFIGPQGLKAHKELSHKLDEKTLKCYCEECDIEFKTTAALETHTSTSSKHNSSSVCSLCCTHCGEAFETNLTLEQHAMSHVLKSVQCKECGVQFSDVKKHYAHFRKTHLGICANQVKRFICEVCGKRFTANSFLRYHQRVHTGEKPYQCHVCNKRFRIPISLQVHSRTHTGEKPYSCKHCSKAFVDGTALHRHLKIHSDTKPYSCPDCGKSFSQATSMKLHIRNIHLNQPRPCRKKKIMTKNKNVD